ncbi:hypothetical protein M409DRAFT_19101 [Zasmidium cellare ATCC 36951]|uniref:Uncharacterized protein n=1 Tax=Zasmidium cellare ATCC 36951 TaxID=1080233 RepID=A0A6A6CVI8_ZASCE|nr:uncharacterized protein M409DRAFT_19101 [Zasmidium cellare ATCC 36951]KAF2171131.1 hypothetical protein M409DRAFT_19101 [Zasmidium cellare ATCC 36951]
MDDLSAERPTYLRSARLSRDMLEYQSRHIEAQPSCTNCRALYRCPTCKVEFQLETLHIDRQRAAVIITKWLNVGNGQSPSDPDWTRHSDIFQDFGEEPVETLSDWYGNRRLFEDHTRRPLHAAIREHAELLCGWKYRWRLSRLPFSDAWITITTVDNKGANPSNLWQSLDMDQSPLGELSPELRNEIYAYVLPDDAPIPIIENSDGIQAPLTRVCKSKTNAFTIDLGPGNAYYEGNQERFWRRTQAAIAWIKNTPRTCHAAVPKLTITCGVKCDCKRAEAVKESLQNVAMLLDLAGYDDDRLQLVMRMEKGAILANHGLFFNTGFKNVLHEKAD